MASYKVVELGLFELKSRSVFGLVSINQVGPILFLATIECVEVPVHLDLNEQLILEVRVICVGT